MTTSTDAELDALGDRLRWHKEHALTGKMVLANPDGPQAADAITALRAELAAERAKVETMLTALQTLRDLMCEAIEDADGNSGCGQCENDCTGCIAHAAITATKGATK